MDSHSMQRPTRPTNPEQPLKENAPEGGALSSASVWRTAQIQRRFSNTLRENAFMETQIQFLKQKNRLMAGKNTFLQDQFLILKEQYTRLKSRKGGDNSPAPKEQNKTEFKKLSHALFLAGKTINKQRQTLQAVHQLIAAHKLYSWNFFKRQKQRQAFIQRLNLQLEGYLKKINAKGNIFQKQHLAVLKNKEQIQNKKARKLILQLTSQREKIALKYTRMKNKWNERLAHLAKRKAQDINRLTAGHAEIKQKLLYSFKQQIQTITQNKQKDIEQLLSAHQEKLSQLKAAHKEQFMKAEKETEDLLNEKTAHIARLMDEVDAFTKQNSEKTSAARRQITEELSTKYNTLLNEKTAHLTTLKNQHQSILTQTEHTHQKILQKLKAKYEQEFEAKSRRLDERMISLKDEQADQLHILRSEMEQELLAERRKFTRLEKTYNADIEKLQKDFRELEAEMELKKFKTSQKEVRENELEALRILNTRLKKENQQLKTLWETQQPESEKQKQQIQALQKINRELSTAVQNYHSLKAGAGAPHGRAKNSPPPRPSLEHDFYDMLKDIHIHTEL